ncbi:hypothetical protein B0A48_06159 [Cryoendolithus antarcticus]|uniref:Heterokaryon incompatibility domain-containing protein n=1 Tax=Cryoendolithus antarcticus TaxID=1507870 RepID=A0A1V8TAA0_9PEZI|nr:hypothetical protein B0A48_06159 [Cryoendolithus antarcticus]
MAQIEAMADIYAGASLVVVAAHGDSASAGLAGITSVRSRIQYRESVRGIELSTYYDRAMDLEKSKWSSRAWTFQERHLAHRCLIFTASGAMLVAGRHVWEEAKYGSMARVPSRDIPTIGLGYDDDGFDCNARYARSVGLYTARSLSEPTDILNAYKGLLQIMRDSFRGSFVHGLPISEIDFALHWRPAHRQMIEPIRFRRRMSKNGKRLFPSWSWAGWDGPVSLEAVPAGLYSRVRWIDSTNQPVGTSELKGLKPVKLDHEGSEGGNEPKCCDQADLHADVGLLTLIGGEGLHVEVMLASFKREAGMRDTDDDAHPSVTLEERILLHDANGNGAGHISALRSTTTIGEEGSRYECIALCRVRNNASEPEEYDAEVEYDRWYVTDREECDMSACQGRDRLDTSCMRDPWGREWLDTEQYDATEPWCRYSVMLISRKPDPDGGPDLASRCGLRYCHIDGFYTVAPKWTRLQLV